MFEVLDSSTYRIPYCWAVAAFIRFSVGLPGLLGIDMRMGATDSEEIVATLGDRQESW
ncbi:MULTISPECIES: hypothetical protein [Oscillatoriales]|uniref:hypothetical protein n=1 Tax=Oscillatoriales TaxID=1150 RepID=UPI00030D2BC2|nr:MULTISPECIES: hypothetical protein [Oscillatoriales]MBE9122568.1 hypothetical protein [Tychonema sp. LEGE 07199]MBE9133889.1 hypothetical protein [Tychonema sp. LEGE 07196]